MKPAPDAASLFPVHVEAGHRYLLDRSGRPFLIHGEAAWSLIVQPSLEDAIHYLDDRQIKGINTLLINLVEHKFSSHAPNDAAGHPPFTTPGDFGTPNEAYFAHADTVLAEAEKRGMLVLLEPAYMGYEGGEEGWYRDLVAAGPAKIESYGRFVAERLKNRANIVWVLGGDFNPPELATTDALIAGIRQVDSQRLFSFHGARNGSARQAIGGPRPWLQVDNIYTSTENVLELASKAWRESTLPFFYIEGRYESAKTDARQVRQQAYQAVLSGAAGQVSGDENLWQFARGWQEAMHGPSAATLPQLRNLLEAFPWQNLRPDFEKKLLASGTESGANAAAAAIAEDRSFALVYLPTARTIKVRLSALAGPQVRARWFDPRVGSFASVAANVAAEGEHSFDAPGNGSTDSVLVLESVAR